MQRASSIVALLILASSALATAAGTVPRKSPEFSIVESGGKSILLSSLKGKVVVMEFLFIKSEHCLRVARTLNKLHGEPGLRGFQPVGVVFDPPNAPRTGTQIISAVADFYKLTFPVGYTSKADVDNYLDRAGNEVLNIPQVVVIDRTGTIRAVSGGSGGSGGDLKLEDESSLRTLIETLLQEGTPVGSTRK
jgi:peroxiredoxin